MQQQQTFSFLSSVLLLDVFTGVSSLVFLLPARCLAFACSLAATAFANVDIFCLRGDTLFATATALLFELARGMDTCGNTNNIYHTFLITAILIE